MRELKFRCWHKIEKRFVDLQNIDFETETIGYDSQGEWNRYETEKFENVIFQQFTCLRDKNGADIYEGDIVECDDKIGGRMYGEVIFDNEYGAFRIVFTDILQWTFYKVVNAEIIGNINENPELLK